jgi:hypothetical protein
MHTAAAANAEQWSSSVNSQGWRGASEAAGQVTAVNEVWGAVRHIQLGRRLKAENDKAGGA